MREDRGVQTSTDEREMSKDKRKMSMRRPCRACSLRVLSGQTHSYRELFVFIWHHYRTDIFRATRSQLDFA